MKVLGINCSPRTGGNTEIMLNEALLGARESGAETELLSIGDKEIKLCDACSSCSKTGKCHINDYITNVVHKKMIESDGIIFGTPCYRWDMCAQAKILIDRMSGVGNKLTNKIGSVIVPEQRIGSMNIFNIFYRFFLSARMFPIDYVNGFAYDKGSIIKDVYAMKASYELGKEIVAFIKQDLKIPTLYNKPLYRIVMEKYKVDVCPFNLQE
jgi:multimeric flavodoxin WrbA